MHGLDSDCHVDGAAQELEQDLPQDRHWLATATCRCVLDQQRDAELGRKQ